jgi:Arc/MetJ-type ribon-helix-helix transcriptional regulator
MSMKLSVSLPDEEVNFLDRYCELHGVGSRSAVLLKAIRLLRISELGAAYAEAWSEWDEGDGESWETTSGDGID